MKKILMVLAMVMVLFVTNAWSQQPGPPARFNDVPMDSWSAPYIYLLYEFGITQGCVADDPGTPGNEARYCPGQPVTREQMAAFLSRLIILDHSRGLLNPAEFDLCMEPGWNHYPEDIAWNTFLVPFGSTYYYSPKSHFTFYIALKGQCGL
jgi:hypothetical protein